MSTQEIKNRIISFINDYKSSKGYQNRKNEDYDFVWECLLAEVYFKDTDRETYENGAEVGNFSAKLIEYYPSLDEMETDNGSALVTAIHEACAEETLHSICISDRNTDGGQDYYNVEF